MANEIKEKEKKKPPTMARWKRPNGGRALRPTKRTPSLVQDLAHNHRLVSVRKTTYLTTHYQVLTSAGYKNDYQNHFIHSGTYPVRNIRNARNQVEGYPKLQRLNALKEQQIKQHATVPFGARVKTDDLPAILNRWVHDYTLQFDTIMIGALADNQLLVSLLRQLPIDKLCAKPGFLFIWASPKKIGELSLLIKDQNSWARRFRRSEELIFVPVDKDSVYYPANCEAPEVQILEETQWHCWMCITGTVRRSSDNDLIHCNVNTDLAIENEETGNAAVPSQIYKIAENFSNSTRRLHIIPCRTGLDHPVKMRPGWVIVSPDVIVDNFDPARYQQELARTGTKLPFDNEIENLRPKTP